MGNVITVNAAIEDILSDVASALRACRAQGGVWETQGNAFLAPVADLATRSAADLKVAQDVRDAAFTIRDIALVAGSDVVARARDALYNDLGRPKDDPYLAILIPGGADGVSEQKIHDRAGIMDGMAKALDDIGHPRLARTVTSAAAAAIRTAAVSVRDAVAAADLGEGGLTVQKMSRRALALAAQAQLVSLKFSMRALRYSEADIHAVIPNRKPASTATDEPSAPPPTEVAPDGDPAVDDG